jgi:hypothetical protein
LDFFWILDFESFSTTWLDALVVENAACVVFILWSLGGIAPRLKGANPQLMRAAGWATL